MKTVFTLMLGLTMFMSASAQYNPNDDWNKKKDDVYSRDDRRRNDRDDDRSSGRYYFSPQERDMQIAQINRVYEYRIQSVKNRFFMSWYQKKRQIEFLKDQRDREINAVCAKFNDRRNRYHDHYRHDRKQW